MTFEGYMAAGYLFAALWTLVCEDAATDDPRWRALDAAYSERECRRQEEAA